MKIIFSHIEYTLLNKFILLINSILPPPIVWQSADSEQYTRTFGANTPIFIHNTPRALHHAAARRVRNCCALQSTIRVSIVIERIFHINHKQIN